MTGIQDIAYLENWFYENSTCWIAPYIEQHFDETSFQHQYDHMLKHLFFTKVVIDDFRLSNELKLDELFQSLSYGKSKIVTIVGGRGQGKTAMGMLCIEELYEKKFHQTIYYLGKPDNVNSYPKWMKFIDSMSQVPDNSILFVDEAGIKYNARRFASKDNVNLTKDLVVLRHHGCTIIFLVQHLRMADINIDRLSDIIIYKPGKRYGNEADRTDSDDIKEIRRRFKPRNKNEAFLEYCAEGVYRTITHGLPTFWDDEKISKSFKSYKASDYDKPVEKVKREAKKKKADDDCPY